MSFPRSKPLRYCLFTLAGLVLVVALLIGAFQIAVTRVPAYRGQLQGWLSEKAGLAIEFQSINARLRLYGPELVFNDAIVRTPDRTRVLATARRGSVGFDLWTSISTLRLTAGRFTLDSPEIGLIRTRAGRIQLVGQSALPEHEAARPIAVDALPVGQFRVRNAVVSFRDEITGRGPWSVSGISFTLERRADLLDVRGDASLPRALGQSLEFSAHVAGSLDDVDALVSTFTIEGQGLDLAGWADVLPNQWLAPETGHGSIELSSTFHGVQPTALTAKVNLANVSVVSPTWVTPLPQPAPLVPKADDDEKASAAAGEPAAAVAESQEPAAPADAAEAAPPDLTAFDQLAFDLSATRTGDAWAAKISGLDLSRKSSPWRARQIEVKWLAGPAGAFSLDLAADRLVLENLWPLLAYLPESESLARLRAMQARGTVDNLTLNVVRAAEATPTYAIKADVDKAGFNPVLNAPGVSGITAHIEGTDARGALRIDSRDVSFTLPRMFRWPLAAQSLQGVLDWQHSALGWQINSERLQVAGEDGKGQVNIGVTVPADKSSPVLDLTGQAQDLNAAATAKYLPANKLTPKTLAWLDAAFPSGRVAKADVTLHGPIRSFPFRRGEGEFVIRGEVENTTFNYQAGWAPAQQVTATVLFRNQGMKVLNGTATVGGLHVAQVSGDFADFKAGNMSVKAHAAGDLGDALTLLQTSPIGDDLGEQFQSLRGQGETASDVELKLPLRHIADRRIVVTTHLTDATVRASGFDAPVTSLNGFLTVQQALPDTAKLQGQWLGGPVNVSIEPVTATQPAALLTATGHMTAAQLSPLLHLPASAKISGATDWQLTTRLEKGRENATTGRSPRKFTIDSDLAGLGIALPYPVGKTEDEQRTLRVEIEYDGDSTMLTRAALGDVHALVRLQNRKDGWQFDRGGVRPDGIAAALPPHPGLGIEGALDRLNLDDWLALRNTASGGGSMSDYLQAVNLRVAKLQIFGFEFPDVRGVLRAAGPAWQVNVAGPNAEGELTIPSSFSGTQPLALRLDRLVITPQDKPEGGTPQSSHGDPRSWPNLQAS
ncbi:MAG TPA: DUF3971 domain-containing protein, partial [Povalibacter sp.]|nr:DUF3971 domain-containing protein [Povalibacter sp.]